MIQIRQFDYGNIVVSSGTDGELDGC